MLSLEALTRRDIIRIAGGATSTIALDFGVRSACGKTMPEIVPFRVAMPGIALEDLKRRLDTARLPERETVRDWTQGVPLRHLEELIDYWRTSYNWRRFEDQINSFPQFRAEIQGLGIHFLNVKSKHEHALPLILTHGWPGSIIEFLKVIGPLSDPTNHGGNPEDAFHVVVPSLPGYGFSDKPSTPGWNSGRIASAWAELMHRLGYSRWVAQGGDWGASITNTLALQKPSGLAAIHLTIPLAIPAVLPRAGATANEQAAIGSVKRMRTDGGGYSQEQSTRPQTIGYALADSPTGLAAWIYEKFQAWTDNDGAPESALTRDEMLDDITLYWLTNTAASSARLYWENANKFTTDQGIVDFPVGVSIFPKEIVRVPRSWADKVYPHLIHWNELDKGGHFAAFEQPALFAKELRDCFRNVRAQYQ